MKPEYLFSHIFQFKFGKYESDFIGFTNKQIIATHVLILHLICSKPQMHILIYI